jgi:putative membrane protein
LRRRQDYIFLYVKGLFVGAAEVIPGVSGCTASFITGIYEELAQSIKSIDRQAVKLLTKLRFADFWKHINGNFLATVFAGMLTSMLSFARLVLYILKYNPILIGSFFFSLIVMAAPLVMREEIKKWDTNAIVFFVVAFLIAYAITFIPPLQAPRTYWFIFIAGALAGIFIFVPGISVATILILLGQYEYLSSSLVQLNIFVFLLFIAGYFAGVLGFSRFLTHLLTNYRGATLALLTGLMLGALNKVWPWREVLEYVTNGKGEQIPAYDRSILPWNYFATTGEDPQVLQAILLMALGVFIVVLIEKIASRLKTKI